MASIGGEFFGELNHIANKVGSFNKRGYVEHIKGHKNSQGELAEWVIKSHKTNEILSSHKSQEAAKQHLQDMHAHSGSVAGGGLLDGEFSDLTMPGPKPDLKAAAIKTADPAAPAMAPAFGEGDQVIGKLPSGAEFKGEIESIEDGRVTIVNSKNMTRVFNLGDVTSQRDRDRQIEDSNRRMRKENEERAQQEKDQRRTDRIENSVNMHDVGGSPAEMVPELSRRGYQLTLKYKADKYLDQAIAEWEKWTGGEDMPEECVKQYDTMYGREWTLVYSDPNRDMPVFFDIEPMGTHDRRKSPTPIGLSQRDKVVVNYPEIIGPLVEAGLRMQCSGTVQEVRSSLKTTTINKNETKTAFRSQGRECDNCEAHLGEDDFSAPGSWSYTCPRCGFSYRHGADLKQQLQQFEAEGGEIIGDRAFEMVHKGSKTACEHCGCQPEEVELPTSMETPGDPAQQLPTEIKEAATPSEAIQSMPQRGRPKTPAQLGLQPKGQPKPQKPQEVGYVPDSAVYASGEDKSKEAGFNLFFPGQVLNEFYPEMQHEMVDYPNANNSPMIEDIDLDRALDTSVLAYVSTSPAGGIGIGRDGKPDVLDGAPLRKENDIRGGMFMDEFHQQYQGIPGALLTVAAKVAAKDEKFQFEKFLKLVCAEIAAAFVAAFKVTGRPILGQVPGIGEVQLAQVEQPSSLSSFNIVNTGSRVKYLLDKMNDGDMRDAINKARAQAAVWVDDPAQGFIYEVFVRAESIDTDTMIMKYTFITGTKETE